MSDISSLTVLSWNLAMFERSVDAPTYWGHSDIEATVRQLVLDAKPDIVVLQELPGLVPFVETHDMVRANPRTHSGNLATLVDHRLMARDPHPVVLRGTAVLTVFDQLDLTVANVHLASGRPASERRRDQLTAVVEHAPTERLLIVGDTNTRVDEEATMTALGLEAPRPPKPTWDGHRNRFRGDRGRFQAFFTRALSAGPVTITSQQVLDEPLEVDGGRFHLSDHFGLLVTVELGQP